MIETTRGSSAAPTSETDGVQEQPLYAIDAVWFDAHHLSLDDLARQRFCDACSKRAGSDQVERVPVFDAKGRMKMEERHERYGSVPQKVIQEHCGRGKNYIHRDMPTLEAVFRILLANGNEPMNLEEVRVQLAEWCPGGGCQWLLLPLESFQRLVDHDDSYGLRRVSPSAGS